MNDSTKPKVPKRYQSFHDRLPLYFEIPIPIPDPRPRGIQSLGALSTSFSVRMDKRAMEKLRIRSQQLGITPGEFTRWCTTKMLDAFDEHLMREKDDSSNRSTEKTDSAGNST